MPSKKVTSLRDRAPERPNNLLVVSANEPITISALAKSKKLQGFKRAYYQLVKDENVSTKKDIIVLEKVISYEGFRQGETAREYLGWSTSAAVKASPSDLPTSHGSVAVFVQTTSHNRKIGEGTRVLYELDSPVDAIAAREMDDVDGDRNPRNFQFVITEEEVTCGNRYTIALTPKERDCWDDSSPSRAQTWLYPLRTGVGGGYGFSADDWSYFSEVSEGTFELSVDGDEDETKIARLAKKMLLSAGLVYNPKLGTDFDMKLAELDGGDDDDDDDASAAVDGDDAGDDAGGDGGGGLDDDVKALLGEYAFWAGPLDVDGGPDSEDGSMVAVFLATDGAPMDVDVDERVEALLAEHGFSTEGEAAYSHPDGQAAVIAVLTNLGLVHMQQDE